MVASLCKGAQRARDAHDYTANGHTHAAVVKSSAQGKGVLMLVAERLEGDWVLQRRSDQG
jgi:hypothetical protein